METLTVGLEEAAARTGVSVPTLRRLLRRGELPTCRVGRRVLIPVDELEKFLKTATRRHAGQVPRQPTAPESCASTGSSQEVTR